MKKIALILLILTIPTLPLLHHYRSLWMKPAHIAINANESGGRYLLDLLATIRKADKITVTEHSDRVDYVILYHTEDGYQEKIYQVLQLTPQDKEDWIDLLGTLESKTQEAFPACIFEPHHRIAFYSNGKLFSTMEVCLQCGQVEWDGTSQTPPWSLHNGMRQFISRIGMPPKDDWRAKYDPKAMSTMSDNK